ncbi:MAG: hypothetical protein ACK56I_05225, partial [bacterium]
MTARRGWVGWAGGGGHQGGRHGGGGPPGRPRSQTLPRIQPILGGSESPETTCPYLHVGYLHRPLRGGLVVASASLSELPVCPYLHVGYCWSRPWGAVL